MQYLGAKTKAEGEIRQKYIGEIHMLEEKIEIENAKKLKVKALIGTYLKELSDIEKRIVEEAKPLTKAYFDYEIPIAVIKDAGITSTGAVSAGNQLPQLQEEYSKYKTAHNLWIEQKAKVNYSYSDGSIKRITPHKGEEVL